MRRGSCGLLYYFETFFISIDGKELTFISIVSCGNGSASKVHLFVIIWQNLFLEKMNEFLIVSEIVGVSG